MGCFQVDLLIPKEYETQQLNIPNLNHRLCSLNLLNIEGVKRNSGKSQTLITGCVQMNLLIIKGVKPV